MIRNYFQNLIQKENLYRESFNVSANVKGLEIHCYSSKTKSHVMRKMISCIPLHCVQQCRFELFNSFTMIR